MSTEYTCEKCEAENIRPFSNYADPRVLCETCAVAEYKRKYPLTWDKALVKPEYAPVKIYFEV